MNRLHINILLNKTQSHHIQKLLENNIIELATDSDLSLDNSIELLDKNELAPQLQEFLKTQKEEMDA